MALKSRFLTLVTVALACLAGATAAAASPSPPVTAMLYAPGQSPTPDTTTIAALESSCPISTSPFPDQYGADGSPTSAITPNTSDMWAVATLLSTPGCLPEPVPISEIDEVIVLNASGQPETDSAALLMPADLTLPSDFTNPQEWPVFWAAGTVDYVRPSRSATDDNVADAVDGAGLELDVYMDGAKPVPLTITASPANPAVNSPVTLSVDVPAGTKGETYDWSFDDGSPDSSLASPTVSFPIGDGGVYDVTVQASGAVDGYGSLELTVGSPTSRTSTTTVKTGPDKSAGKTPGGSPGKRKRGPATTKPKPKPKHKRRERPAEKHVTTTTTRTSTAATAPATPSGGSGGRSGSGGSDLRGRGTGVARSPAGSAVGSGVTVVARHRSAPTPKPPVKPQQHVQHVTGKALGAVVPLSGGLTKLEQEAATRGGSAPPLSEPAGPGPWALAAAIATIVLLFGLGAGRELRHVRSAR